MENEMEIDLEEEVPVSPVHSEIERGQMIDDSEMNQFDFELYDEQGIDQEEMDDMLDDQKSTPGKGKKSFYQKDCAERKPDMIKVFAPEKPCVLPKTELIPREQLSKQKYLDLLSAPSKKCPTLCEKKQIMKRALPLSPRVQKLALPSKRSILGTLEASKDILPPEMIDNLIKMIEMETCLSPEQTTTVIKNRKHHSERSSKSASAKHQSKMKRKPSPSRLLDEESSNYQYLLAQRFVKSMLNWKCNFPYEDYQDLSKVVFKRICNQINYVPTVYEDRKSEQIRFLADIVAGWILGIVAEVAEEQKEMLRKAMEREGVRDQKEEPDVDEISKDGSTSGESSESEQSRGDRKLSLEDERSKKKDAEDEDKKKAKEEKDAKKKAKEEEKKLKKKQKEEEKAAKKRQKEEEKEAQKRKKEEEKERKRKEKEEEKARKEQQEREEKERLRKEAEEAQKVKVEPPKEDQQTQEPDLSEPEHARHHFKGEDTEPRESLTEVVELVHYLLKGITPNACDETVKKIQEALYCEVISTINQGVSKNLMSDRKEIFEICAAIATWIKRVLDDCGVDLNESSNDRAEDEDRKWLLQVIRTLIDWFGWLRCKIGHYKEITNSKFSDREWDEWQADFCENHKRFTQMHLEFLQEVKCNF